MRESNRRALIRVVCEARGIETSSPFKFSVVAPNTIDGLPDEVMEEVGAVFQRVGGIAELSRPRLTTFVKRLGVDDCLSVSGKRIVVEYDEVLHFSPFRKITLRSRLYDKLKVGFILPDYLAICGTFRITGGSGRAHNPSAHAAFRCPVSPGECRHRQRAFYDFLKDVILGSGFAGLPRLVRISDRTDFINGRPPSDVVERGTLEERRALVNLLRARAGATVG